MLDHEDLKWMAISLTELNRRLQQISRYSDQVRTDKGEGGSLDRLNEEAELASKASQALFDRVLSSVLSGVPQAASQPPAFKVMPPAAQADATPNIPVGEMSIDSGKTNDAMVIHNPNGRRELILVVDDKPEILEMASEVLGSEDYRVMVAKDGLEALQIYNRMGKDISLIILDFFLPVINGDAVFDELKAINPNVQVVLSSGFAEQTKLGSMLARGLRGFIPKPYTGEKLIDQVRSIMAA